MSRRKKRQVHYEATNKPTKAVMGCGLLMLLLSCAIVCMSSLDVWFDPNVQQGQSNFGFGVKLFLASLCVIFVGQAMNWWHHE